jgi:hypothetical protein
MGRTEPESPRPQSLHTGQGSQGEGHQTIHAGLGHCLLPQEQQDLALRDLCAAVEATSEAVTLAAMTGEEGRNLLPSDFFNHAYQAQTGQLLDETIFRRLAVRTSEWCQKHEMLFPAKTKPPATVIAATRLAHEARRDATRPFGPYEFAFREAPAAPIQFSCKKWEEAWNHPDAVWIEKLVGVSPWPAGELSWPRAIGTWVHRWLMTALRVCGKENSAQGFLTYLRQTIEHDARLLADRADAAGIELYPWWAHVHGRARAIALGLGESLAPVLEGKRLLSERTLPDNLRMALPGSDHTDFDLKGRIDLLIIEPGLTPCDPEANDFSGCTCWVVDFKTGLAQNLTTKKIEKGKGLQAVLYALAVKQLGASSTSISLHTLDAALKPQVHLEDVLELETLFRSLDKLHRDGIFGMRATPESDYGFTPAYPMATRPIATDILNAKWALVHGGADSLDEEESE